MSVMSIDAPMKPLGYTHSLQQGDWLITYEVVGWNHHYIMRYSDSCELPLSEVTEWFKNYMKGE